MKNESAVELEYLTTGQCAVAIVLYTAIAVVALVGNSVVVFIILHFRKLRTPTNFLILNLAVADILMSIFCIPLAYFPNLILLYWPFGGLMCKVIHFCQILAVLGTSYTLIAISFDRFLAITFPLRPNLRLTYKKVSFMIALVWILSGVFSLPDFVSYRNHPKEGSNMSECDASGWYVVENATGLGHEQYGVLIFALQFWIPLFVLVSTYTGIAIVIWRSRTQPGAGESAHALKQQDDRRDAAIKMFLMMFLITVLFVVCWLPQNILMNYLYPNYESWYKYRYIYHVWWGTHTFAMSHSVVNPIVYVCRNSRFREGFAYVFRFLPFVHYQGKELEERRRGTLSSTIRMVTAYVPVVEAGARAKDSASSHPEGSVLLDNLS